MSDYTFRCIRNRYLHNVTQRDHTTTAHCAKNANPLLLLGFPQNEKRGEEPRQLRLSEWRRRGRRKCPQELRLIRGIASRAHAGPSPAGRRKATATTKLSDPGL